MSTFTEYTKELKKRYKSDNVLVAGDAIPQVELLSMGTLSFDYAVSGGLPYGSVVEFAGQFGCGKSTAAALALAQYQRANPDKTCVYVDVENSLQLQLPFFVKMTGLQTDAKHLMVFNATGIPAEHVLAEIMRMEMEVDNIGMIVLDSTASLVSSEDLENDFTKDNGMRSATAKWANKFMKQFKGELKRKGNILLTINQAVVEGKTFTGANIYNELGGKAWKYHSDLRIRFGTRTFVKDGKTDIAMTKAEGATGFQLKFAITKSRIGAPNRGGGFLTCDYDRGLETVADTIDVAVAGNYIARPNNMTYILADLDTGEPMVDEKGNELKFIGKAKLIDYLTQNDDFREKYFAKLSEKVSGQANIISLLDKETLNEINEMEEATKSNDKEKE